MHKSTDLDDTPKSSGNDVCEKWNEQRKLQSVFNEAEEETLISNSPHITSSGLTCLDTPYTRTRA
jgi:hypothetical protein